MFTSLLAVLLGIASQSAIIGADGKQPDYWKRAAVLYAEMVDAENVEPGRPFAYKLQLKPLAVLTGMFDAAQRPELPAGAAVGHSMLTNIQQLPRKGAKVVVLVQRGVEGHYNLPNGGVRFFPVTDRVQPAIFEVTGLDDPKIGEVMENLRKLRGAAPDDRPAEQPKRTVPYIDDVGLYFGRSLEFWKNAAVIYAEAGDTLPDDRPPKILNLQPIAVLTGNFDAALQGETAARVYLDRSIERLPAKGTKVVVLVERDEGKYRIPGGGIEFFRGIGKRFPALWEVKDFNDPVVGKLIEALQNIRTPEPYIEPIDRPYR